MKPYPKSLAGSVLDLSNAAWCASPLITWALAGELEDPHHYRVLIQTRVPFGKGALDAVLQFVLNYVPFGVTVEVIQWG